MPQHWRVMWSAATFELWDPASAGAEQPWLQLRVTAAAAAAVIACIRGALLLCFLLKLRFCLEKDVFRDFSVLEDACAWPLMAFKSLRNVAGICCLEGTDGYWAIIFAVGRGALSWGKEVFWRGRACWWSPAPVIKAFVGQRENK